MWYLWRERYAKVFEGHELSKAKLKYLLLKSLFDWTFQHMAFFGRRVLVFLGFFEF